MKLQYGMCIVIILIVALGVFWTSSPFPQLDDEEDVVFFNAVKKPNPESPKKQSPKKPNTESPKKPNPESPKKPNPESPKKPTKAFKKVFKKVDKKVVDKLKQQLKDAKIKLEKTKPGSKARKDAEKTVKELQRQLTVAQGGGGGVVQTKDSSSTVNFGGTVQAASANENAQLKALMAAESAYSAHPTTANKAAVDAAQTAYTVAQVTTLVASAAATAQQSAAKAEAARKKANAYPTPENKVAAAKANTVAAVDKLALISSQGDQADVQVAAAEAAYAAHPNPGTKAAVADAKATAAKIKTALTAAQTSAASAQTSYEAAAQKVQHQQCVPGKPCIIMDDNNSGFSQKYIDQLRSDASKLYAKMAKDFPRLFDANKPVTVHLGLDQGDTHAQQYKDVLGYAWDGTVTLNIDQLKNNQKGTKGVIAHELFHVLQGSKGIYGPDATIPSWFTEGSADWARDKYAGKGGDWALSYNTKDSYTKGYTTAGGFLKYLDLKKPGSVASILNNVYQTQYYDDALWKNTFGQPLQTLYSNYQKDMTDGSPVPL